MTCVCFLGARARGQRRGDGPLGWAFPGAWTRSRYAPSRQLVTVLFPKTLLIALSSHHLLHSGFSSHLYFLYGSLFGLYPRRMDVGATDCAERTQQNHRIMESFGLEKTCKMSKSSHPRKSLQEGHAADQLSSSNVQALQEAAGVGSGQFWVQQAGHGELCGSCCWARGRGEAPRAGAMPPQPAEAETGGSRAPRPH